MAPLPPAVALVRLLAPWAGAAAPAPADDLAQQLARWVSAFDAIGLHAAHRAVQALDGARSAPDAPAGFLPLPAFTQLRTRLRQAIALPAALPNEWAYAPYRRRHQELQRLMEQTVGDLREQVRARLAQASPALRQLALMDAALDKLLSRREAALLPLVGALLERRHAQCQQGAADTAAPTPADLAAWRCPGGWLHQFEADWQQVLCAELDLRLQPVAGLIEAAGHELDFH